MNTNDIVVRIDSHSIAQAVIRETLRRNARGPNAVGGSLVGPHDQSPDDVPPREIRSDALAGDVRRRGGSPIGGDSDSENAGGRGATYSRRDMFFVRLGDDPVPWDRVDGGAIYSRLRRMRYEELTLTRLRSDQNVGSLCDHITSVGKRTEVVVEQMNSAAQCLGVGLVYEGRIVDVLPVQYSANSNDPGEDRVVFRPDGVHLLWS